MNDGSNGKIEEMPTSVHGQATMRGGRGASILSSILFIAITSGLSLVADFGIFNSETQLAQVNIPSAKPKTVTDKVALDKKDADSIEEKCTELKSRAIAEKRSVGGEGETELEKGKRTLEKDRCVSATYLGENTEPQCEGLTARVYLNNGGSGRVKTTPGGAPKGVCKTEYCKLPSGKETGETCTPPTSIQGSQDLRSGAASPDVFKNLNKEQQQAVLSNLDKSSQDALHRALGNDLEIYRSAVDEQQVAVANAKAVEDRLKEIAETACFGGDTSCSERQLEAARAELARKFEEQRMRELQAQHDRLAAAQKSLTPGEAPPGKQPPDVPQVKTPVEKQPPTEKLPPDYRTPPFPSPTDTFNKPGGDLASLLQKILGSIPGGQSPGGGGAQSPLTGGACTEGAICHNSALYQQYKSQDATYYYCTAKPVQQCPYGCAGNACAPAPQQCPTAPIQPDPARCSLGSWRPTYNGPCVANWQCVPGSQTPKTSQVPQDPGISPTPPIAELSCQPKVADVGMSLTISYSCTAGVSEGIGLATNGAQSGSTTFVLANPPGSTNTATYGLACTHEGRRVQNECSVQIGKPSIILVANPKNVERGNAATLGWVTSGMKSCVISSPELAPFTSENAARTNLNGTVPTPALSSTASFVLHCLTQGGGVRGATTTVSVK